MAELGCVPLGDKQRNRHIIAIKLGEGDFLPIYFEPNRILRDLNFRRGPLDGWVAYSGYRINEEALELLKDGYPVTAQTLFSR